MAKGRMINSDISDSKGFARLSPEAAVLFCMLIPHFNSYGKMNGDPHYIKGEVCPRVPYLDVVMIESCLREISDHTNVKWFEFDERLWIHSTTWEAHQALEKNKRGEDKLPNWEPTLDQLDENSTTSNRVPPDLVAHEEEDQVEDQDQVKDVSNETSCRKKFHFSDADLVIASWMFGLLKNRNSAFKLPNMDAWANEIRLMVERDGRTHEEVQEMFQYAHTHKFWYKNILSPSKLREKWDRLVLERKGPPVGNAASKPTVPFWERLQKARHVFHVEKPSEVLDLEDYETVNIGGNVYFRNKHNPETQYYSGDLRPEAKKGA